jgi:hypothetical protein
MEAHELLEALEEHISEMWNELHGEQEDLNEEAQNSPTDGKLKEIVIRQKEITAELNAYNDIREFIEERRDYVL